MPRGKRGANAANIPNPNTGANPATTQTEDTTMPNTTNHKRGPRGPRTPGAALIRQATERLRTSAEAFDAKLRTVTGAAFQDAIDEATADLLQDENAVVLFNDGTGSANEEQVRQSVIVAFQGLMTEAYKPYKSTRGRRKAEV